jgi:hypothetical protein
VPNSPYPLCPSLAHQTPSGVSPVARSIAPRNGITAKDRPGRCIRTRQIILTVFGLFWKLP